MRTLSEYALKESAEALRTAKVLNDVKMLREQDALLLATLAEATQLSGDRKFIYSLFDAGKDSEFEMSDKERELIVNAISRRHTLVQQRFGAVCKRVRNRAVITRARYLFEHRVGADQDTYPGLNSDFEVREHLQRIVEMRTMRITHWLEAGDAAGQLMLREATDLVTSLPAELVYRVRHGIRRRSDVFGAGDGRLSGESDDVRSQLSTPQNQKTPPAASIEGSMAAGVATSSAQPPPKLRYAFPRPPGPTKVVEVVPAAVTAELEQLRAHVGDLTALVARLQRQLAANAVQGDELGFRITQIEVPLVGKFLPTMGGIGAPPIQHRSLEVLATAADVGSMHPAATRRRPGTGSVSPRSSASPTQQQLTGRHGRASRDVHK
jgi:hypothetical protein